MQTFSIKFVNVASILAALACASVMWDCLFYKLKRYLLKTYITVKATKDSFGIVIETNFLLDYPK